MRQPVREIAGIMAVMPWPTSTPMRSSHRRGCAPRTADMGKGLFGGYRYDGPGRERPDFVLNREPYPPCPHPAGRREFRLRQFA